MSKCRAPVCSRSSMTQRVTQQTTSRVQRTGSGRGLFLSLMPLHLSMASLRGAGDGGRLQEAQGGQGPPLHAVRAALRQAGGEDQQAAAHVVGRRHVDGRRHPGVVSAQGVGGARERARGGGAGRGRMGEGRGRWSGGSHSRDGGVRVACSGAMCSRGEAPAPAECARAGHPRSPRATHRCGRGGVVDGRERRTCRCKAPDRDGPGGSGPSVVH